MASSVIKYFFELIDLNINKNEPKNNNHIIILIKENFDHYNDFIKIL